MRRSASSSSSSSSSQFCFSNVVQLTPLVGPIRTLASRKAYDEPSTIDLRRKKESERFHPYAPVRPAALPGFREPGVALPNAAIGLDLVTKWPFSSNIVNNGELTIVRSPPSPPQNEPVDFSTKKPKHPRSPTSGDAVAHPDPEISVVDDRSTFTSSKELRFSKNLRRLIGEICRRKPVEGRIIVEYLKTTWNKLHPESNQHGIRSCTAANGQQSQSGGSFSGRSGNNSNNSSSNNNNNNGNNSSGGGCGGSGSGSGGGNGQDGGSGGGSGSGGNGDRYGGGGGGNGNGHNSGNGNGRGNGGKNSESGRPRGSILDMDLDFEDLPTSASSTAKWFSDHPDINAAKVLDGLLNLKTEFPPGHENMGLSKPPDLASLDHATANLLQMSVPDPSTTFLDIGTDLGGTSLYEDDPFSLEHLLPSNFNINQLDMAQSPNERLPLESSVNLNDKRSFMSSGHTAVVLPSAPLPPPGNYSEAGTVGAPVNYAVNAHLSHLEPLPASALAGRYIKTEPVIKTELDITCHPPGLMPRSHNNNMLAMFGNDHHDVSAFDPMHLSSRLSPVSSSMGSMPSPGSPPTSTALYEKLPPGLAITALAAAGSRPSMSSAHYGHSSGAVSPMSPPIGGGKMKSPGSGSGRKKAPVTEVGQEDEELLNIPSLQVRISILQQRVSH